MDRHLSLNCSALRLVEALCYKLYRSVHVNEYKVLGGHCGGQSDELDFREGYSPVRKVTRKRGNGVPL